MKNLLTALFVGSVLVVASSTACSSSDTTTNTSASDAGEDATSAGDAGGTKPTGDGGGGASDGGGACNAIVNAAPESTSATVKGAPPAPTGGKIADGTYFQTEFVLYDATADASPPEPGGLKAVLVVAGNVMNTVLDIGDGENKTFTETFTTNGTALDRQLTCPKVTPDLKATYSVDGNKLTIYETDPNTTAIAGSVYVKQ